MLLVLDSTITESISISTFACLFVITNGIMSSEIGLEICATA